MATVLVGETYFDRERSACVVVEDELLDRSGAAPSRTGHFRVVGVEGAEQGCRWIAAESALEPCTAPGPRASRRRGPPHPIAAALVPALARIGALALPLCRTEAERAIARALAECTGESAGGLRSLAALLLTTVDDSEGRPR